MKKLADKYGICILLIHHLRKQTASDPFDQISGSTGLMGVADTSWVMQRKRMSQTADILLTGRDMDDRTLHLREENCIWTLEDEETAEEREIKAVPDYLWKAAEYIESVGNWQGTASELLAAAAIEDAKPNQFTYNMAKYFDKVFEPKNIRYKTHRKNKVRLLSFYGDGGDDDIDITQLSGWGIPERPSPSSLGALEGSKQSAFKSGADADIVSGIKDGSCCAAIFGTWNAGTAEETWGENYAAIKLPTYTLNGEQVQMASFSGYKLVGVNPHSSNVGVAMMLADYITNEDNQAKRFNDRKLGPSNILVNESEAVQSAPAIAALAAQSDYATLQRVGANYWSSAQSLGEILAFGDT